MVDCICDEQGKGQVRIRFNLHNFGSTLSVVIDHPDGYLRTHLAHLPVSLDPHAWEYAIRKLGIDGAFKHGGLVPEDKH